MDTKKNKPLGENGTIFNKKGERRVKWRAQNLKYRKYKFNIRVTIEN